MTDLPASLIAPVKITAGSPNGFLVAHKPAGVRMLALEWEGQVYAMYLSGDYAFRYFPVRAGVSLRGALVSTVEFRVDLTSAYDAMQKQDPLGALVLNDGQLYAIGILMGDGFADPVEVPLWGKFSAGTNGEKVGFTKWSIVVREGDKSMVLFSHEATVSE
jgi:hypothetical protein